MKVLSIGSDRKLFEDGSAVSERIKEYGAMVEEYHVVVFAKHSLGLQKKQLAPNVWIYPTNSISRWLYVHDASRIGKEIVFKNKFIRGQAVITAQDPFESGLSAYKVKKGWRLPLEIQLHTDPFSPNFNSFLNIIRKFIARMILRKADSVRVVTKELRDKISAMTKARINILPIYIDSARLESAKASFDLHTRFGWHFILLVVSRLAPEKNLSLALETLALVYDKYPDTGLVIVGSGPEMGRLKALAKKLKIENAVAFVGWQDDITSYYKTANAFIQTSLFEGYGLSLIEAGLSGLPILTTPVGIAKELESGRDVYIYPADRPDLFALGVLDLIRNNFKRESLRINMMYTLKNKLISKEEYLKRVIENWQSASKQIQ